MVIHNLLADPKSYDLLAVSRPHRAYAGRLFIASASASTSSQGDSHIGSPDFERMKSPVGSTLSILHYAKVER